MSSISTRYLLALIFEAAGILSAQQTVSVPAQQLYTDLRDHKYWYRSVIVPPESFTLPQLRSLAQEFLGMAAARHDLAALSVFTDVHDAAMATTANRDSYKQWRLYYDAALSRQIRTADVVAIGDNAVLRVREAHGRVVQQIISGTNPLVFEVDGTAVEILVVRFRRGTRFDQCDPGTALSPIVYAKASNPLSTRLCKAAAARVAGLLKERKLFIMFRPDQWFISSGSFPVPYPFAKDEPPPSEEAYNRTITLSCSVLCEQGPACVQTQGSLQKQKSRKE